MENSASGLVKNKLYTRPQKISKMQTTEYREASTKSQDLEVKYEIPKQNKRQTNKHQTAFGLQRANFDLALKRKKENSNRYYKGQEVPLGVQRDHFKIYGPGIYLFFQFLWKLSILLFVLSLLSLIPIVYNYLAGTNFANSTSSLKVIIGQLSISNFDGDDSSQTTAEQIANTRGPKILNCVVDLVSCFFVIIFYFYWNHNSAKKTDEIKQSIKLANYLTLQLTQFHESVTDTDVQKFFSRYGLITEVAPVKNYSQTIQLSKQIFEYQSLKKQLIIQQQQDSSVNHKQKTKQLSQKIQKLYIQLAQEQKKNKDYVIKYYISFQTQQQRSRALNEITRAYRGLGCCQSVSEQFLLKGYPIVVKACHNQPDQILWENVHITWRTRWIRALAQLVILLLCIAAGFVIIATLNILTPSSSSTTSIDTTSYNSTSILSVTNTSIIQAWCLKNIAEAYTSTTISTLCTDYINSYYKKLALTYAITIIVVIVKMLMKHLVIFIAKFQRYKSQTEQSIDIVKNLVIVYIVTTVIIGFLLQADLAGIQFKNLIPDLVNISYLQDNASLLQDYSELSNNWYCDIGYQIWLTWLIMSLTPHIYMPIVQCLLQCWKQRCAKKQVLQKNMDQALQSEQFQIQDNYANIIMILIVGLAFSGGMPIIICVCFVAIYSRYLYFKYQFIRFCKIPKTIDQALNQTVLTYFPWALGIHFCMSIWMYSVESIFAYEGNIFSQWVASSSSSFVQFLSSIFDRLVASYYYTLVAIVFLLIVVLKQTLYDFIQKLKKNNDEKPKQDVLAEYSGHDLIAQMKSQRGLSNSYKMQNNPDYFEILSIKQKMRQRLLQKDSDFNLKDLATLQ